MSSSYTLFNAIGDFIKNIPNFMSYFFDLVNCTLDIIPRPFGTVVKVLLAIATIIMVAKIVKKVI